MRAWVVLTSLCLAACATDVRIAPKESDLPETDTDVVDDAPEETGDSVVPIDTAPRDCILPVTLDHTAPAVDDLPVPIEVTAWTGVAAGFVNVVARDRDGDPLPHWVQGVDGGTQTATIWVKVPHLDAGDNRVVLDACDSAVDDVGAATDVFLVVDPFDDPAATGWTTACHAVDHSLDECTAGPAEFQSDAAIRLDMKSSCYSAPYSGVNADAVRTIDVPAGLWKVRAVTKTTGTHHGFCSGGTSVTAQLRFDGTKVAERACGLSGCSSCDDPPTALEGEPWTSPGGPVDVSMYARSGDCAEIVAWFDDLVVWQVADPMPTITLGRP